MFRPAPALLLAISAAPFLAPAAMADVPRVLVDTAPLHSLVSQVMAGVGAPDLLLPPGVSPHDFQFRPSDATNLTEADLVIWTGHGLVPWLEEPLETLAPDTSKIALLESAGWDALPLRTDVTFVLADEQGEEGHDHDHDEHDHDHDHNHGDTDPHAWLSPDVAQAWLSTIAATLGEADPDNAATYTANATAAEERLVALKADISTILAPVLGRPYIVPHDAYQYFETAFGMPSAGAITLSDASAPGPARLAGLQEIVASGDVACILTDPETSPAWSAVLSDGTLAKTAMADPDGMTLPVGPDLYDAILRGLATALADCLS
jgi:zinc transport system substrate-binding protein